MTFNIEAKDNLIKLIHAVSHQAEKVHVVDFDVDGVTTSVVGLMHSATEFEAMFVYVNDAIHERLAPSADASFLSLLDGAQQVSMAKQ